MQDLVVGYGWIPFSPFCGLIGGWIGMVANIVKVPEKVERLQSSNK